MTIEVCTHEEAKTIVNAINEYNLGQVPPILSKNWIPLDFVLKNSNHEIIGGILSGIGYWGGLEIKILWVRTDQRKKGFGSKLLQKVEKIAISKGAQISILDTFDFQAEQFYIKNGYNEFGRIKNFPKDHQRIYLSKRLT